MFYNSHGPVVPGTVNLWDEYQKYRAEGKGRPGGGLIGSPDTVRERLRQFEASHVDQVILLNQAGRNTHEDICASLERFARDVMPEFQAREPQHQAWKQAVLRRELELPEIDTKPYDRPSNQTPTSRLRAASTPE